MVPNCQLLREESTRDLPAVVRRDQQAIYVSAHSSFQSFPVMVIGLIPAVRRGSNGASEEEMGVINRVVPVPSDRDCNSGLDVAGFY